MEHRTVTDVGISLSAFLVVSLFLFLLLFLFIYLFIYLMQTTVVFKIL